MAIHDNIIAFMNAVKTAKAGSTITLKSGTYDGNIDLDYRGSGNIDVIMHGVTVNGDSDNKKQKYALDLKGNNISVYADGLKLIGGNDAVLGVRGHNLKIVSDLKGYITGHNRGCLQMGTNHHIQGLNFDGLGNVGIGAKGFPIKDNINRTYGQDFGWYPSHNWRVTQCIFQNIQPRESGDAGGGYRLIPHIKDVIVDNCLFRNIKGSGLWGDHNQKGFGWYYNTFEDIDTKDAFGKAMFLEIMDPDPNDKSGFVAKIAGNTFVRCDTQTVLIAASSGQNPGGIDVFGNTIIGGWGIIAGAMQRPFLRKWDFRGRTKDKRIEAQLKNIRIRKNLIHPDSPNHISIFQGRNSGLIEIDNNYYVTGGKGSYTRANGTIVEREIDGVKIYKSESDSESLFVHGKSNAASLDRNAITGEMPSEFPFPEIYAEIPVTKVDIFTGAVDIPVNDEPDPIDDPVVIDDPIIDDLPTYGDDLPRVVITTDFQGPGEDGKLKTDPDDIEALALTAMYQDYVNIEKVIIASNKQKAYKPLEFYNQLFKSAYEEVVDALNDGIGDYWKESLGVIVASSNGEGFTGESIDLAKYPSTKAIIDLIREDDVLNVLWWGTGAECANAAKWIVENAPEKMANIRFISHAASKTTHNNYKKDKAAAEYMEHIGETYGNYYSLGFSGKVIDGKHSYPLVKINAHDTELGKLTTYKHSIVKGPKTDGSDAIASKVLNKFFGGGESYIMTLNGTGKSNESKVKRDFENLRPEMFPDISTRFKMVKDYDGGTVIDDPIDDPVIDPIVSGMTNEELKARLSFIIDYAQELYDEL